MAKRLPAGMRNNNPGNIKYVGQKGTRPSVNLDQGDPQAVYPSAEAGMRAMYDLLLRKYSGGKRSLNEMIAEKGGWTPGNYIAAANVARYASLNPNDDIRFTDPASAAKIMRALMLQEHGEASRAYTDDMITAAITGKAGAAAPATYSPAPTNPNVGSTIDFSRAEKAADAGQPATMPQGTPQAFPDQGGYYTGKEDDDLPSFMPGGDKDTPKNWMEVMGQGMVDAAKAKLPGAQFNRAQHPKAALAPAEQAMPPVAPVGADRQQLAMLMLQRLNSGRLF